MLEKKKKGEQFLQESVRKVEVEHRKMKKNRWWIPQMMEYPFWRDDITPEEFEFERAYYYNFFNREINARKNYIPLWKQGKVVKCNLNNSVEVIELAEKMQKMSDEELEKILYTK